MKKFNAHTMILINIGISIGILLLGSIGFAMVAKQKDIEQLREYEAIIQRYEAEKVEYKLKAEELENQAIEMEKMIDQLEFNLKDVQSTLYYYYDHD